MASAIPIAVVTGANGYVASEIVAQLLRKGYNVRGTIRNNKDPSRYAALTALADALPGTLTLFEADLTTPNSYDEAVKGATYVFHVASPATFVADDPQREIVDPAVNGTLSLLGSIVKSKDTVKRVVLTSSTAAIAADAGKETPGNGVSWNESDWNTTSRVEDGQAYNVSKVEAEKAAWKLTKAEGIDLVTILASLVVGPALSHSDVGFSIQWQKNLLETGAPLAEFQYPFQIDVRDVGRAHILAAEVPTASGRYLISQTGAPDLTTVAEWWQEAFPQYDFTNGAVPNLAKSYTADNGKAINELGLVLTPFKTTYLDIARTFIQLGIAKPRTTQAS